MKTSSFGVYQIRNTQTGDLYVGSTTRSFHERWRNWISKLRRNTASIHLQNAWNKYGEDAFEFSILEELTDRSMVLPREQFYIDNLSPRYNLCLVAGNRTGFQFTEESLTKIRESRKHQVFDVTAREKMRAAKLGKPRPPFSEQHRKRLSEAAKRRDPEAYRKAVETKKLRIHRIEDI